MTAHTRRHVRVQIDRRVRDRCFRGAKRVEFCDECSQPIDVPNHWGPQLTFTCNACKRSGVVARPASL